MARLGDHDDIAHALIPLTLAVGLIRHRVYAGRRLTDRGRDGDLNALASFIAATVPLYEYASDPSKPPRALRKPELEGGMFRDEGRELRFIDGRATRRYLALRAEDVERVTAWLKNERQAGPTGCDDRSPSV